MPAGAFLCALTIVAVSRPAPAAQRSAPSTVTYYKDVAPILQKNCETCHRPGQDGRTETVLNVPRYDFNWQLWYDTSVRVPRGTKMRGLAWYDNSPENKFNPNPNGPPAP